MFEWSGYVILVVILYVVIAVVFAPFATLMCEALADTSKGLSDAGITVGLIFFTLSGWIVLNGANYVDSTTNDPINANGHYAAAYFGLQSNHDYPLVVGSRLGGSQVAASASSGIFSANSSVSVKPESILSVSYTHADNSYILELPTSSITFIQSTTASPSVRLRLTRSPIDGFTVKKVYTSCQFKIHNLVAECGRHQTGITTTASSRAIDKGLSPIVSQNLDSAVVTLTPKMYQAVLGTP